MAGDVVQVNEREQFSSPMANSQGRVPIPPNAGMNPPGKQFGSEKILPTLFGEGYGIYETKPRNFAISLTLHCVAILLALYIGKLVVQKTPALSKYVDVQLSAPVLPAAKTIAGGGGGGGAKDLLMASKGNPPKANLEQQIVPPTVIKHNEKPKLTAEESIVAPPQLQHDPNLGDPLRGVLGPPSNGVGINGGIGNGRGTGVGSGDGSGFGPGRGGGMGGGYYHVGGGVSPPRAIFSPDPEYSEEARKAKYQGTVVVWIVVGPDGRVHEAKVQRSIGLGLDEKALEAVKLWKFDPALKDGRAVPVAVSVEVNFHLY